MKTSLHTIFKQEFTNFAEEVNNKIKMNSDELRDQRKSLTEAQVRMEELETFNMGAEEALLTTLREQRKLQEKLTNFEGRSRRNNVQIFGVPEGSKGNTVYRPISILNCDYRIYTTILTKRLETFLAELINEDQCGSLSRWRQAQDNTMRTLHIIEKVQKKGESTMLLSLDAEKAFDSVSWKFLYLCLEKFGFNTDSVNVIKTLYHDPKARIKINGYLTNWFNLKRSTRQGCCLSPTLFAIFIEPLAQAIREDEGIAGIEVRGTEHKIGLFVDNVLICLKQPDVCLPKLMERLDSFYCLSGYKLKVTKTQVLSINYTTSQAIQQTLKFKWNAKTIKYLGVILVRN